MAEYERISANEWRWPVANRFQGVRLFSGTGRLIWSRWVESSEGPQFDEGIAQTVETFLSDGPPEAISAPDDLVAELRATVSGGGRRRRGLFGWF